MEAKEFLNQKRRKGRRTRYTLVNERGRGF